MDTATLKKQLDQEVDQRESMAATPRNLSVNDKAVEQAAADGPQQSVGTQTANFALPGQKEVTKMVTVDDSRNINKAMTEDAKRTKEILWKEQLVTFVVPLGLGEKAGIAEEFVSINDYKLRIKKGVVVELPQSVVKMLMDHYNINEGNVMMDKRLDRDENIQRNLSK